MTMLPHAHPKPYRTTHVELLSILTGVLAFFAVAVPPASSNTVPTQLPRWEHRLAALITGLVSSARLLASEPCSCGSNRPTPTSLRAVYRQMSR